MISKKEIEKMNIAFDFSRQYTIARVPKVYRNAEQFALEVVYSLRPYISDKLGIDHAKIIKLSYSVRTTDTEIGFTTVFISLLWETLSFTITQSLN